MFGGDEAIAGTPTNPPFEQCFAGSQHSKHTSEILRCHPSNQLNKVVVTSCYVSIFVFDNFPNKNMSYVTFLHFPPTKKHPQKKTRNHPASQTHQAPPSLAPRASRQGVCVHLFGEMHSCDLIPTVGGQFLLRCLYALGGRVELS